MALDHVHPKVDGGENFITNRVLLCAPCNSAKSDKLTMRGLHNRNKETSWMRDKNRAQRVLDNARTMSLNIRDYWDSDEIQSLLQEARRTTN